MSVTVYTKKSGTKKVLIISIRNIDNGHHKEM